MKGKVTKKVQQVNKSLDRLSDAIFPDLSSKSPSKSPTKQTPASPSSSSSTTSIPSISTDNRYQVFDNMDTIFKGASTVEAKLDIIMATLVEALEENRKYKEEIKQLTIKVNTIEKDNMKTKKELRYVKESANRYELSARSLTVRFLGLPVSQEEATSSERNKVAVKNAYDRFLKPIFNAARAKGHITSVPQLTTAISEGFRLNTNAKDKRGNPYPAPLLIKFSDKTFRTAIFLCKREVLASLKEEGGPIPIIVEDLTAATLAKMKELREDERIEKVWTTEGSIRFTLVADPEKVRKFPGAFTPLNEAIK
jgi:regulator of replication initiation timing